MKKSLHPGVAIGLIVIVVVIAGYFIFKGMEPQREPNAMSAAEINKQMQGFNQRMQNGGAGNGSGTPPAGSRSSGP